MSNPNLSEETVIKNNSGSSEDKVAIAVDAMGGDNSPEATIKGLSKFSKKNNEVFFKIFGNENQIKPLIEKAQYLDANYEIIHTEEQISGEEKPSIALRKGRKSSMGLAISAVKEGKALAAVSSGNTGALMALAKFTLQTLPTIDRPAICGLLPSETEDLVVMLDLGANIHCDAENLYEFAIMGEAFAKAVIGKENPSVGLLNVGSEKNKGHEVLRLAHNLISEHEPKINFLGYIEGDDIYKGTADVIVTDGFTGNIALKTAEGTAKFYTNTLKKGLKKSPLGILGMGVAMPSIIGIKKKMDPRNYNGAMFLGLNGIVVKSHGGSDATGFANALSVAFKLAKNKINQHITNEMMTSPNPSEDNNAGVDIDFDLAEE